MTAYDKRGWKYRRSPDVKARRQAAQAARDQAVRDIQLKLKTRPQVAQEMGVTLRTVNEWVWVQAKKDKQRIARLFRRPPEEDMDDETNDEPTHEMASNGSGNPFGAGGRMSDDGVRKATRSLERKIVEALAGLGYAPMTYRK